MMGIEYEQKFLATPEILQKIRQSVEAEEREFSMETAYYDTPDKQFSRRNCTLRCRLENGQSICTLKTPAQEGGRREFEVAQQDIRLACPVLCKQSGLPFLAQISSDTLIQVCAARFQRIAKTVVLEDCVLELALDEGVLLGGGKTLPLCEVEVELKSGSREAAFTYGRVLAALFSLQEENRSKFARAFALSQEK